MCGIVAVLRQRSTRPAPDSSALLADLEEIAALLGPGQGHGSLTGESLLRRMRPALGSLQEVDRLLHGSPGLRCLLGAVRPRRCDRRRDRPDRRGLARFEAEMDQGVHDVAPDEQEEVNQVLVALKDAWWAIDRDRLGMARSVADLFPAGCRPDLDQPGALDGWWAIQVALTSLDRLEVRGRDSAGVQVLITDHGLDFGDPEVRNLLKRRATDPCSARARCA